MSPPNASAKEADGVAPFRPGQRPGSRRVTAGTERDASAAPIQRSRFASGAASPAPNASPGILPPPLARRTLGPPQPGNTAPAPATLSGRFVLRPLAVPPGPVAESAWPAPSLRSPVLTQHAPGATFPPLSPARSAYGSPRSSMGGESVPGTPRVLGRMSRSSSLRESPLPLWGARRSVSLRPSLQEEHGAPFDGSEPDGRVPWSGTHRGAPGERGASMGERWDAGGADAVVGRRSGPELPRFAQEVGPWSSRARAIAGGWGLAQSPRSGAGSSARVFQEPGPVAEAIEAATGAVSGRGQLQEGRPGVRVSGGGNAVGPARVSKGARFEDEGVEEASKRRSVRVAPDVGGGEGGGGDGPVRKPRPSYDPSLGGDVEELDLLAMEVRASQESGPGVSLLVSHPACDCFTCLTVSGSPTDGKARPATRSLFSGPRRVPRCTTTGAP